MVEKKLKRKLFKPTPSKFFLFVGCNSMQLSSNESAAVAAVTAPVVAVAPAAAIAAAVDVAAAVVVVAAVAAVAAVIAPVVVVAPAAAIAVAKIIPLLSEYYENENEE